MITYQGLPAGVLQGLRAMLADIEQGDIRALGCKLDALSLEPDAWRALGHRLVRHALEHPNRFPVLPWLHQRGLALDPRRRGYTQAMATAGKFLGMGYWPWPELATPDVLANAWAVRNMAIHMGSPLLFSSPFRSGGWLAHLEAIGQLPHAERLRGAMGKVRLGMDLGGWDPAVLERARPALLFMAERGWIELADWMSVIEEGTMAGWWTELAAEVMERRTAPAVGGARQIRL